MFLWTFSFIKICCIDIKRVIDLIIIFRENLFNELSILNIINSDQSIVVSYKNLSFSRSKAEAG